MSYNTLQDKWAQYEHYYYIYMYKFHFLLLNKFN